MTAAVPQWQDALAKANRVRIGRADLRRQVRSGERSLVPILLRNAGDDVLELTADLPILDLLCWQTRVGTGRARTVLYLLGIPDVRHHSLLVTDLSNARRLELVALFIRHLRQPHDPEPAAETDQEVAA